ncbi:hypothetical protein Baya_5413 [Bagarius yarrelli]|uniref:Uncharacterized protein n=1 Tax=Bagarius yarrelli TaxID=175774 RepID=A0A556TWS2_BAGYA|nr:hypothetical protein Baya_5413 [Bagarius yarrelli]
MEDSETWTDPCGIPGMTFFLRFGSLPHSECVPCAVHDADDDTRCRFYRPTSTDEVPCAIVRCGSQSNNQAPVYLCNNHLYDVIDESETAECSEQEKLEQACRVYSVRCAPGATSRGDRAQESSAAKDTRKTKHLLKKLSKDLSDLSPIRTKIPEEKTNDQDLIKVTKRSDREVSCSKPKGELRRKTSKDERREKKRLNKPISSVEMKGDPPEDETWEMKNTDMKVSHKLLIDVAAEDKTEVKSQTRNSFEDRLTSKFTSSIKDYIMSPTFKRQLSERIMEEISVQIAQAVSQSPEPRRSIRFGTVKAEIPAISYLQEVTSRPGFSLSVMSLLCYELIETRDKIIEYLQSKSAELRISSNAEIEIVRNIFKSIFASLIKVETLHPPDYVDTLSPDSVIHSYASHVFSGACESLTVSADEPQTACTPAKESGVDLESCQASLSDVPAEGVSEEGNLENPPNDYIKNLVEGIIETGIVKEPTEKMDNKSGSDEGAEKGLLADSDFRVMFGVENLFQIRATFIPKKIMKKLKSLLTSITHQQEQSSEPEVKSKDENEGEDEDEDGSILAAFFLTPQTSKQNLQPDEKSEEHLVIDSGVDPDQALTFGKNIPSEVDERDFQPSEHQELSSPVSSPDSLRESPDRTTCPPEQTGYSPVPLVSIPETSDTETTTIVQKEEDDLQPTFPQSDLENTTSFDSAENTGVRETDSTYINVLTTEALDQDQFSSSEVQSKDRDEEEKEREREEEEEEEEEKEEEGIIPASESISNLYDPQTSRVETPDLTQSVPEGVTESSGEVSNFNNASEEAATHFIASLPESPVPSSPCSEIPDSPQRSPGRRTCSPQKASSMPNVFLSIPDKAGAETIAIIQNEDDILKTTVSLDDIEKTVNLESPENQEVKEMGFLLSEPLDQDWSSGASGVNRMDEDNGKDESISDNFISPHQTSAIEADLNVDEETEEKLMNESNNPDQVSLSEEKVSCEADEQDLPPTGPEERASPVPSLPSSEESACAALRGQSREVIVFKNPVLKTSPYIRVPEKGKPPPKDLNQTNKRSDRSVSFAATPKVKVPDKTFKDESRAKKNTERKEEEPQINTEDKLRTKITGAIINYIKSTPFKRQLSEHIVWEISVKIAKAVSQYHEQQQAKRVYKAKTGAQSKNSAGRRQRERSSKLGFSISVASLLGYELIESRDKMIDYFKSKSAELPTSSNTETEIVKNVFESILAFVINVETLHPVEDIDTYSPDRMIDSFESILQNINLADSESSLHELSDDESSTSSAAFTPADKSDLEPPVANEVVPFKVDALKVEHQEHLEHQEPQEHISGPRKFMEKLKSFLTPAGSDQDQSSEVDVKEKEDAENEVEEEKIQAEVIPATHTTVMEQDLEPEKETEENLAADSGIVLDQATFSEENILPDVDERDLQLGEQQELSSPVPSPPASEKPDSPRESPNRTTCPPEQISYSPDLPVSIPETSDTKITATITKEEDDLQQAPPLRDMEMTVSLKSEEQKEEMEKLDPDQKAEEQIVVEPDVDLEQVLAAPSEDNIPCEASEQDLQPIIQEESSPRKSAMRSTRPSRKVTSVYSTKKGMKKGSVSFTTSSRPKDPRMSSRTIDSKRSTVRKAALTDIRNEHRPSPTSDVSNQSLEAPKTEPDISDAKTMAPPTDPEVTEEKPSECDKEQIYFWSSIHKKNPAPVNKKRMDFSKCCTSCNCDRQMQDQ